MSNRYNVADGAQAGPLLHSAGGWVPAEDPAAPMVRRVTPPAELPIVTALTESPGSHAIVLKTTYQDRAEGFRTSTAPVWFVATGATAALVTIGWAIGPVGGWWAFLWGWWISSLVVAVALVSLLIWLAMWWQWWRASPDAVASRQADARLRMAESWFNRELERVYGHGDNRA
jgi:Zn-dependent protease with chaperone function